MAIEVVPEWMADLEPEDVSFIRNFILASRLCHFIENESSRNVVFISISGRFALK